jgi:uncharacterized protein with ACT and thioredoxin-like domain
MRVVEALNVVEDRGSRLTVRGERLAFEQFALQGGEERLGDGIVKAIPRLPRDGTTPSSWQRLPKATLVYWQPWSE